MEGTRVKLSENTQLLRSDVHLTTPYKFNTEQTYTVNRYEGQHASTERPDEKVHCWRLTGGTCHDHAGKELGIEQLLIPQTALIPQE